jgi:hypothetical protein
MYSGSTLTKYSGRVLGAHQKIDRMARRHLTKLSPQADQFPAIASIMNFEGAGGPDAIKRKSPAKDEPWHYIDPFDETDTQLYDLIEYHYKLLVKNLRSGKQERAAFEAAWLAHAVVDGLTPAHHFPYEEKLSELRGGMAKESRVNYREKLIMHGDSPFDQLKNNWKMWGPKGLFLTHLAFEWGVATTLATMPAKVGMPPPADVQFAIDEGILIWFRRTIKEIAALDLYGSFYEHGWTRRLAGDIKQELIPRIVEAVTLSWYCALEESQTQST